MSNIDEDSIDLRRDHNSTLNHRTLLITSTLVFFGCLTPAIDAASAGESAKVDPSDAAVAQAVQRRIDAFNNHDLDGYLAAHKADVQIYRYPDRLLGTGRAHLKNIFEPTFVAKKGRVKVLGQFVMGQTVVSREHLTTKDRSEQLIAIYTVADGKIASLRLIAQRD